MNNPAILTPLFEILGEAAAKRFLQVALPQIQAYRFSLLDSLQQHDWETAATLAHRFKATAHLYSTKNLQQALETLLARSVNPHNLNTFMSQLETELLYIEANMQTCLDITA